MTKSYEVEVFKGNKWKWVDTKGDEGACIELVQNIRKVIEPLQMRFRVIIKTTTTRTMEM